MGEVRSNPQPGSDAITLSPRALGHLGGALQTQWKCYRKQLRRCQHKFSEKAVHEFRVGVRRLLASVELLSGFLPVNRVKKIKNELKQHLDNFDDLRDTQIQRQSVSKMRRQFATARKFYSYLAKREDRFTRRSHKAVERLKCGRLAGWIQDCLDAIEQAARQCPSPQAQAVLLRTIDLAFAHTRRLRNQIDPRDPKTIHRTRVAFKRFRYMIEALADCVPSVTEKRLDAMHQYQTLMGDIQDSEVLLTAADKFLCKRQLEPQAVKRFRSFLLRRRQALISHYLKSADKLLQFWPLPSD